MLLIPITSLFFLWPTMIPSFFLIDCCLLGSRLLSIRVFDILFTCVLSCARLLNAVLTFSSLSPPSQQINPIIYIHILVCLLLFYPSTPLGSACAFYILIVDRVPCVTLSILPFSPLRSFCTTPTKKKSRQNASFIFLIFFRLRLPTV